MSKKQRRKVSLIVGLVVGVLVDGYLRLTTGDEGNLLVHTIVFLGSAVIATGVVYGLFYLWDVIFLKDKAEILVEDMLAKYIVDTIIKKAGLNSSRLINILPIGGWENVLKFQHEANITNTFGIGTKVFSILDGDIQNRVGKAYKSFSKLFLPIGSIEKYLLKIITDPNYSQIKKEINDHFFYIESLDSILANYYKDGDNNGKHLYQKLRANLEQRRISEDAFIKDLCPIIMKHTNFTSFESSLTHLLS